MENKIISINISPDTDGEINENAGVMWEHNATSLVFNIDPAYVDDYRYYIEYRSLIGTKVRTEYLSLNLATNTITYDIPVTMTSLRGVECYFNIVKIDDDGQTVQVIKPRKFYLQFDYSPGTDDSLEKANDFSINALLEAIRLGTFQGGSGGTTIVDSKMSDTSENPVQNKIVKKYVDDIALNASTYIDEQNKQLIDNVTDYIVKNLVFKETGKGLSSNDFTDDYKNKLDNLEDELLSVESVAESDEDGGSNVVTFNDGSTLTIKNGNTGSKGDKGDKGDSGYAPVKGIDYYTETDKQEIKDESIILISQEIAKREQIKPEFANNVNECTDTTKLYVLPDDFIYAYMYSESPPPDITIESGETEGYWTKDGNWNDSSGIMAKRTNIISVDEGDKLSYQGYIDANSPLNASAVWYDGSMNIISTEIHSDNTNPTIFTAPTGAENVRFYSYRYVTDITKVVLEVSWVLCQATTTDYQWTNTGHAFVPADYEDVITDLSDRVKELEEQEVEIPNVLKDKTIIYDGDSICYGESNGGGYAKIIAEQTGGYYVNQALGGATLVTRTDETHSVVDNLKNLPTVVADLYCFEGGLNDVWQGTKTGNFGDFLGTYDMSDYTGTVDKTTICGALETIFRYALDNFEGKPICFIIPHKVNNISFENYKNYHDSAVAICNKYSIPYYDAYNESGLNGWNDTQKQNFTTSADGIHPNEEGYKRYYVPQLISLFEKIMPR